MTEKEIYKRLGLQDPWVFAVEQMRRNLDDLPSMLGYKRTAEDVTRATGRTTRALVTVLADMSEGGSGVVSIKSRMHREHYQRQLKRWAADLGIPYQL